MVLERVDFRIQVEVVVMDDNELALSSLVILLEFHQAISDINGVVLLGLDIVDQVIDLRLQRVDLDGQRVSVALGSVGLRVEVCRRSLERANFSLHNDGLALQIVKAVRQSAAVLVGRPEFAL